MLRKFHINGFAKVPFTELANVLEIKGNWLTGIPLAGEDCKFHSAKARIEGPPVVLSSAAALMNGEGCPSPHSAAMPGAE